MALAPVDPARPDDYPPNIKAMLKKPSPASLCLGLVIEALDREAGEVAMRFEAGEHLQNKWGGIQGGMVAAMLDEAMSLSAGLVLEFGQICPTLEMKTSFLAPAYPGTIKATSRVIKRGRSIAFTEGRLMGPDGTLIATGSMTVSIVTLKPKEGGA